MNIFSYNFAMPKKFRSSRSQMFFKIGVLKSFTIFSGKHLFWSLFLIKLHAYIIKKRLQHMRFPMNIAKLLRTAFYIEQLWWLLPKTYTLNLKDIEWLRKLILLPVLFLNESKNNRISRISNKLNEFFW